LIIVKTCVPVCHEINIQLSAFGSVFVSFCLQPQKKNTIIIVNELNRTCFMNCRLCLMLINFFLIFQFVSCSLSLVVKVVAKLKVNFLSFNFRKNLRRIVRQAKARKRYKVVVFYSSSRVTKRTVRQRFYS